MRPQAPDDQAVDDENLHDALAGGPHGLENGDVPGLFHDHHEEGGGDAEGRHQDDQGEDDEHGDLLKLQGREEAAVHLHPVLGVKGRAQVFLDHLPQIPPRA